MIKKNLTIKLFLVLLLMLCTIVVAMALLSRWSFQKGFTDYLNQLDQTQLTPVVQRLEDYYKTTQSWKLRPHQWDLLRHGEPSKSHSSPHELRPAPHFELLRRDGFRPLPHHKKPPLTPRAIAPRLNLLNSNKQLLLGHTKDISQLILHPLKMDGNTVGWLGLEPNKAPQNARDIAFMQRQGKQLYLIALIILIIAAISSILLARWLLTPIKDLAQGARTLTQGDYDIRVVEDRHDELGQLALDFNRLAETLAANETARRRWIADISHELRTPLAVLRGEIEALQDGVRPCNQQTLQSLHSEVKQLNKLVDDLYQLSLSDLGALDYHKTDLNMSTLLEQMVSSHQNRFASAHLILTLTPCPDDCFLFADHKRITQLFDNLLENSLRYTDAGGRVEISCHNTAEQLFIDIKDSAPGVSPEALPQLFERLYREEASRNRAKGGAGLGLAIVQNIIEAHQGKITAQPSTLGGLHLMITFALKEKS